jgi:hypothetical protein
VAHNGTMQSSQNALSAAAPSTGEIAASAGIVSSAAYLNCNKNTTQKEKENASEIITLFPE